MHHHPSVHAEYERERHSDLLRQARAGELAAALAAGRRDERRSLLERLWRERRVLRPASG